MNRAVFFDRVRARPFGGVLTQSQVTGINVLLDAFEAARWPLEWIAYALATAKWETAHTMQPIAEYGRGAGQKYGARDAKTGQVYYGRGYVQLTWKYNYAKAGEELGIDLVSRPELAMQRHHAARIMIAGMSEGWFTGKKLSDYIGPARVDYVNARRIINGTDKAQTIAAIARDFESALKTAGYEAPQIAVETKAPHPAPTPPAHPAIARPADMAVTAGPDRAPGFWSRVGSWLGKK